MPFAKSIRPIQIDFDFVAECGVSANLTLEIFSFGVLMPFETSHLEIFVFGIIVSVILFSR